MNLDKVGIAASSLCVLHCTLLPVLVVLFPIFSISLFATELFEWIFLVVSLILCLTSLCFGYKKHKSFKALSFAGIGFTVLVVARLIHSHNESPHLEFNVFNLILICGGIMVALSHYINTILCKKCQTCSNEGCCNG